MTPTILILGAAGRLGQVLASTFADAGWQVRAQARKALPDVLARHPRAQAVRCDATDTAELTAAARGTSVVVNALSPLYTDWDRLALPLADVAMNVARASGALLMLPGNIYNFGRELPPRLSESTPESGDTPKARIRIEMEARLARAAAEGIDSVVIRAGDFFGGPGAGTWLDMAMMSKLAKNRFVYPGNVEVMHAWAYLPDLAQAFVRVAAQRSALHGHHRLHFEGHTLTGRQFQTATEAVLGRTLRAAGMPWWLIRAAAPMVPMWRELLVMRYLWERPHALVGTGLRSLIGAEPHTPLARALRATLAPPDQSSAAFFSASARS